MRHDGTAEGAKPAIIALEDQLGQQDASFDQNCP